MGKSRAFAQSTLGRFVAGSPSDQEDSGSAESSATRKVVDRARGGSVKPVGYTETSSRSKSKSKNYAKRLIRARQLRTSP
jgi:hypothetical protein